MSELEKVQRKPLPRLISAAQSKTFSHTHLHTGEVGEKTCLTSPDLTCKFSFRVYVVIVELLLEKGTQRVDLERDTTS